MVKSICRAHWAWGFGLFDMVLEALEDISAEQFAIQHYSSSALDFELGKVNGREGSETFLGMTYEDMPCKRPVKMQIVGSMACAPTWCCDR